MLLYITRGSLRWFLSGIWVAERRKQYDSTESIHLSIYVDTGISYTLVTHTHIHSNHVYIRSDIIIDFFVVSSLYLLREGVKITRLFRGNVSFRAFWILFTFLIGVMFLNIVVFYVLHYIFLFSHFPFIPHFFLPFLLIYKKIFCSALPIGTFTNIWSF